jgi:hypothetical protein
MMFAVVPSTMFAVLGTMYMEYAGAFGKMTFRVQNALYTVMALRHTGFTSIGW